MSHLYVKWEFWRLWEIIYKVLAVVSDYKKWQISPSSLPLSLRVLLTRVCTNTLVCHDVLTHLDNSPTHVSTHFDLTSNSRNSKNSLLPNLLTPLLKNSLKSVVHFLPDFPAAFIITEEFLLWEALCLCGFCSSEAFSHCSVSFLSFWSWPHNVRGGILQVQETKFKTVLKISFLRKDRKWNNSQY